MRDTAREKRARQTTIDELYAKEKLSEFTDVWLQWIYAKGLPFNAFRGPEFQRVRQAAERVPRNVHFQFPSYKVIAGVGILSQRGKVATMVSEVRGAVRHTGATILSDGRKSRSGKPLVNFLAGGANGALLYATVARDGSVADRADVVYRRWWAIILSFPAKDVIGFCTDSASNYTAAARKFATDPDADIRRITWLPCSTHVCNLMLSDVGTRVGWVKETIIRARALQQIRDGEFWRCVDCAIRVMSPIHQLLRRMDRGGMMMSIVYEWSHHLLELMRRVDVPADMVEPCVREVAVRNLHMLEPAHAAAHLLNPRRRSLRYYESLQTTTDDAHVVEECDRFLLAQTGGDPVGRLYRTVRDQIWHFHSRRGDWGYRQLSDAEADDCRGDRETERCAQWWFDHGRHHPELHTIAIRVMDLWTFASPAERNWAQHERINRVRRHKLGFAKLAQLVEIATNLKLAGWAQQGSGYVLPWDVFGKRAVELRPWPEQTSDADADGDTSDDEWTDNDDVPVSGDATAERVYFTYGGGPDDMTPHTSVITDDVSSGGQASGTGRAGARGRRRPRADEHVEEQEPLRGLWQTGRRWEVRSDSEPEGAEEEAEGVPTGVEGDGVAMGGGGEGGGEDEDEDESDHGDDHSDDGGDDDGRGDGDDGGDHGDDGGDFGDHGDDGDNGGGEREREGRLALVLRDPSVPSLPLTRPEAFAQAGFDADDLARLGSHDPFPHTGRRSGERSPGGAYSRPPYIVDSPRWSVFSLSGIRGRESGPVDGRSGRCSDGGGSAGSMPPPPARSTEGGADATMARAPVAGSPPPVAGGVADGWAAHRRVSDRMRVDYDAGRGAFAGRLSPRFQVAGSSEGGSGRPSLHMAGRMLGLSRSSTRRVLIPPSIPARGTAADMQQGQHYTSGEEGLLMPRATRRHSAVTEVEARLAAEIAAGQAALSEAAIDDCCSGGRGRGRGHRVRADRHCSPQT
ncbi:hypothetical protein CBR_g48438 [Chara braunii]|uniref:DUF659 domain-containing protein n=1 Tax=Chara braunii TaxID=69332 RepID=A0A388M2N7_CHABU|nr:hypothetical protein CBR_g48438 [Chara braunii]|eukprot:GBG88824.1 hypothetical protein CBR_g48438 [Chara braunii]